MLKIVDFEFMSNELHPFTRCKSLIIFVIFNNTTDFIRQKWYNQSLACLSLQYVFFG